MATPRFYCPAPLAAHQTIELPAELAHHAMRVLRLKAGTPITLFDGRGGQYPATLVTEGGKGMAETGARQDIEAELPGKLTLVQGIASGDKMDWIIEKAVELGASRLIPVPAQRSVLLLKGPRLEKRQRHWERVAQSASEQCGRNRLMRIDAPCPLDDYLLQRDTSANRQVLCCHPGAGASLARALRASDAHDIDLLVGPEGGWSDQELSRIDAAGVAMVQFGPRVLRTETAGLALLAAVGALKGWE